MIYLDNAATSYPKPAGVRKSVYNYMQRCGASYGRGGYKNAVKSMDILFTARQNVSQLIGNSNPERLIFTKNATEALNTAILGTVKPNSTVVVSPMEHNSVMRPLRHLHCRILMLGLNPDGSCCIDDLPKLLPKCSLAVITHASNVSGIINDIPKAAAYCKRFGTPLVVDAAQSAGTIPIFADDWNAMIAFAGHKSLMGPQGTGGLYIPDGYKPTPLITGGTGSHSELLLQPEIMPEKYESGTINMPAVSGLSYSSEYIAKVGMANIRSHEAALTQKLIEGLLNIKNISVIYPENQNRTSAVSFVINGRDTVEAGRIFDEKYSIAVRCGLHCAPSAHKTFGTFETGTIRVSPGWFSTKHDIDTFLYAVNHIV